MIQDLSGAIIADFRGSTGNLTASKNSQGSYFKVKIQPPYINTAYTLNVRNRFTTVTKRWSSITDTQRTAWRKLASSLKYSNKFADKKSLNGMQLFVKHNIQSLSAGYNYVNDAVPYVVVPLMQISSATLNTLTNQINIVLTSSSPDWTIIFFGTDKQGANAYSIKGKLKKLSMSLSNNIDDTLLYNSYANRYSVPLANDNILLGYKFVNSKGQSTRLFNIKLIT